MGLNNLERRLLELRQEGELLRDVSLKLLERSRQPFEDRVGCFHLAQEDGLRKVEYLDLPFS